MEQTHPAAFYRPNSACSLPLAVRLLVKIRFPFRPRLPAFVNPQPLFRIKLDHPFHCRGKACGIDFDILAMIAGAHQIDRRVTVKEITLLLIVPDGAGWDHYCIGFQRSSIPSALWFDR